MYEVRMFVGTMEKRGTRQEELVSNPNAAERLELRLTSSGVGYVDLALR